MKRTPDTQHTTQDQSEGICRPQESLSGFGQGSGGSTSNGGRKSRPQAPFSRFPALHGHVLRHAILDGLFVLALLLCSSQVPLAAATPAPGGLAPQVMPPPHLPSSYYAQRADLEKRYGQYDKAVDLLRQALAMTQDADKQAEYQIALAGVYDAAGKLDTARAIYKDVAEHANAAWSSHARLQLAQSYVDKGQSEEGIQMLEDVALKSPLHVYRRTATRRLARALAEDPKGKAKRAAYENRLKAEPKNADLLALVLDLQREDPGARARTLEAATQAFPNRIDLVRDHAESLVQSQALDQAEAAYEKMREDYPSQSQLANEKLALIAQKRGQTERAVELIEKSAARIPAGVRKDLHLARRCLEIHLDQEAAKHARAAYQKAQGKAMRAATATELGEALVRLNQQDEARTLLAPVAEQELWRGLQVRAKRLLAQTNNQ